MASSTGKGRFPCSGWIDAQALSLAGIPGGGLGRVVWSRWVFPVTSVAVTATAESTMEIGAPSVTVSPGAITATGESTMDLGAPSVVVSPGAITATSDATMGVAAPTLVVLAGPVTATAESTMDVAGSAVVGAPVIVLAGAITATAESTMAVTPTVPTAKVRPELAESPVVELELAIEASAHAIELDLVPLVELELSVADGPLSLEATAPTTLSQEV